jgi:beta-N-acetylhexosaminidase
MGQGAFILGCQGLILTEAEKCFFKQANPWGFILFGRNVENPAQLTKLCADLRDSVGRDAPILIDQEGGRVQRLRSPHWREFLPPLDDIMQKSNAERTMWLRGRLIADDLARVGIDVNCAPILDVARDATHPFLRNRCYGTDPQDVATLGRAMVDGLAAGGVASVMKHIPGHGRSTADSHKDLPRVTVSRSELVGDFAPFKALNSLTMGMSAHIVFDAIDPDLPATQSPACIDLIRNDIGFQGLLMTDDISMEALSGTVVQRADKALKAGCDLVLHCNGMLDEMEQIAALGGMSPAAQTRADIAANTRPIAQSIDIAALDAEFHSL